MFARSLLLLRSVATLHRCAYSLRSYLLVHYSLRSCSLFAALAHYSLRSYVRFAPMCVRSALTIAPLKCSRSSLYQVRSAIAALMPRSLIRFAHPDSLRSTLIDRCAHIRVSCVLATRCARARLDKTDASWRSCGASLRVLFLELRSAKNIPL
jgi:hypothetical protein